MIGLCVFNFHFSFLAILVISLHLLFFLFLGILSYFFILQRFLNLRGRFWNLIFFNNFSYYLVVVDLLLQFFFQIIILFLGIIHLIFALVCFKFLCLDGWKFSLRRFLLGFLQFHLLLLFIILSENWLLDKIRRLFLRLSFLHALLWFFFFFCKMLVDFQMYPIGLMILQRLLFIHKLVLVVVFDRLFVWFLLSNFFLFYIDMGSVAKIYSILPTSQ